MVYEHKTQGTYEWADDCAPDDLPGGVEIGRCAACGLTRLVKRVGARNLCKGCAMDAGLYQEAAR